jgi:N6-L-threonylcarbamoyladenine synthase
VLVLGIETSCDETAAAVVADGRIVRSNVVASQIDAHAPFGGIVPEVACRAHAETVLPVIVAALERAGASLDDLDGIAVTHRPGLVGALLVGLQAAKGIAFARGLPLIGVDHIEGHLHANQLDRDELPSPILHLVVSGAHTHLYLGLGEGRYRLEGRTIDDAAGEALDKVSILLGLGYPGGPAIERAARGGDPRAFEFPRALDRHDNHDFSFSGFKTSVRTFVSQAGEGRAASDPQWLASVAASVQEAVVDILARKTFALAEHRGVQAVALTGGVAANQALRERFASAAQQRGLDFLVPDRAFCTDNAAMIAGLGGMLLARGERSGWELDADPRRR